MKAVSNYFTNPRDCIEIPMDISSNSFINAVDELVGRGYDHDFRLRDGKLLDVTADTLIDAGNVRVDAAYRFEAGSGSDDRSNLFAISLRSSDIKGLLIDAFDLYQQDGNYTVLKSLDVPEIVSTYDTTEDAPTRYGVPKVSKADFNKDPIASCFGWGFRIFRSARTANSSPCSVTTLMKSAMSGLPQAF
jgi:hypothetical protein